MDHLAPAALCFHVKDFRVRREWHNMGFRVEGAPAGKGQHDITWSLGKLGPRCQSAILELWPPELPSREEAIAQEESCVRENIAVLRRWIPGK